MIIVPLLLLAAVAYRTRNWSNPRTRPITIALAALAVAITLRIPSLGDRRIDPAAKRITGISNISEWATESLVIIAAAAFLAWVMNSCGVRGATRKSAILAAVGLAAIAVAFGTSNASRVQTDNLTALPGAQPYWGIFTAILGLSMAVIVYAATQAVGTALDARRRLSYQLLIGAGAFGLAYCVHKIIYLLAGSQIPFYLGTAWILVGTSLILFALASFAATSGVASRTHEPTMSDR